jgi:hypothetical protein
MCHPCPPEFQHHSRLTDFSNNLGYSFYDPFFHFLEG